MPSPPSCACREANNSTSSPTFVLPRSIRPVTLSRGRVEKYLNRHQKRLSRSAAAAVCIIHASSARQLLFPLLSPFNAQGEISPRHLSQETGSRQQFLTFELDHSSNSGSSTASHLFSATTRYAHPPDGQEARLARLRHRTVVAATTRIPHPSAPRRDHVLDVIGVPGQSRARSAGSPSRTHVRVGL